MKKINFLTVLVFLILSGSFLFAGTGASARKPLYPEFPPITETKAFESFKARPQSEYSKIIYMIDRFEQAKLEIIYDGLYYKVQFAARLARWFVSRNYHRETCKSFIMKWCNATVPLGNLIWVKLPNGKFKLSREVLLNELKDLEAAASTLPAVSSVSESSTGPVPTASKPALTAPKIA